MRTMALHRRRSSSREARNRVALYIGYASQSPTRAAPSVELPTSEAREYGVFSKLFYGALISILVGTCIIVSTHLSNSLLDKPYRC